MLLLVVILVSYFKAILSYDKQVLNVNIKNQKATF
jgi:hypothetical protein